MPSHTLKAFTSELNALTSDVLRMGGMAEAMITDMATALLDPGASMLWACVTETATQGSVSSAATFGTALIAAASTMAGAFFASAFGV